MPRTLRSRFCLSHESGSGSGLVLEVGGNGPDSPVVTREPVHTRLDENQTELGVHVLPVALEVLADADGLLDQVVQVLGNGGSKTFRLEDSEDLKSG